jgi:penicillin-binding protein 1C
LVKSVLSDREARSATFGLENSLSTRFWTAVKTGTSKDMRDNWTVGFSQKYTVGVWSGNFSGSSMWNVSGVHGAAPVWLETMNYLHEREPSLAPEAPPGLVSKRVRFVDARQERDEWFLPGTEPAIADIKAESSGETRLLYPVPGTVIAIDPRLPSHANKMYFQIANPRREYEIRLDGKSLGPAKDEYLLWAPRPGSHRLSLLGADKRELDSTKFYVKGAL